jgi:BlaI family penicillinase repressor
MKKKLTPAEWEIMQAIWDLGESASVRDVLEHLYPNGEKAYTTVQTLMNNLVSKKLLNREKIGLVGFYSPVPSRDEATRNEMSRLVSGVFGGSIPALASSLMSLEDLDLEDLAEIKRLLRQRERQLKDGES